MSNPLLSREAVPALNLIKPEHYMPAVDAAVAELQRGLEKIRDNPAAPSFENTVVPLEALFDRVNDILFILRNADLNIASKELSEVEKDVSIKVSNMRKVVFQDPALVARFQAVETQCNSLHLDEDDKSLLHKLHGAFESGGAFLPPEGQVRIREIDEALIGLVSTFKENTTKTGPLQQAVLITDPAELDGLTKGDIATMEKTARDNGHRQGWLFIPERLLVDEMLGRAGNRSFRKKIFEALNRIGTEGKTDNRPVLAQIQALRHEYAQLLGYDNYAAYARSRAMMTDLDSVKDFIKDVTAGALPQFEQDMKMLEGFSAAHGGPEKLEPWDVPYWSEQQRKAQYDFDSVAFSRHLPLDNVLKGLFAEAGHLFGLSFRESTGRHPVLHPDIRTFDVTDRKTGKTVGILHMDLHARPGTKNGGAWVDQLQLPSEGRPNIVILNMNFDKPADGTPPLLAPSQYVILYHEMGHALQGLLGTDVKYRSQQGLDGSPTDFAEIHSMINEHRALLKENLRKHALSVDTGLPPTEEALAALGRARSYFQSCDLLKLVQNSLRDIAFHEADPAQYKGLEALEKSVALDSPCADHARPYPLTRFWHLFSEPHSIYATGYVNYLIAQAHAADGFDPFKDKPYDPVQAARLKALYRRGSGGDPLALYRQYRGRDATPEAMLREAGIETQPKPAAKKRPGPSP